MGSYSPRRNLWAKRVQTTFAIPIYKQVWPDCTIEEIDIYANDDRRWLERDFSGLDKIICLPGHNEIHLAQRFRSADSGSDFSLRFETAGQNGTRQEAEFAKLMRAYKEGYWFPQKYAFGHTLFGMRCDPRQQTNGFDLFYIFDLRILLQEVDAGRLRYKGPYPNGDRSSGIYFDVSRFPEDIIFYEMPKERAQLAFRF